VGGLGVRAESEGLDLGEEDRVFGGLSGGVGGGGEGEKREDGGVEEGEELHVGEASKFILSSSLVVQLGLREYVRPSRDYNK
jgi:hypothetical protein